MNSLIIGEDVCYAGAAALHDVLLVVPPWQCTHSTLLGLLIVCHFLFFSVTHIIHGKVNVQSPRTSSSFSSNVTLKLRLSGGVSHVAARATCLQLIRWITRCSSSKVGTAGSLLSPWSIDLATLSTCASLYRHHHQQRRLSEVLFSPLKWAGSSPRLQRTSCIFIAIWRIKPTGLNKAAHFVKKKKLPRLT